ncbi:flagellar assembly protein FliH [Devosia crocina]|uniref:Flagellar assembly protein FliH n=1 Tax=Devosia crocina TaxID=429728 RepID=A0A1I7MY82_9HYPH|nr:FliH/SctL family protein [Devosia crocina]SFV27387.1 flagellar assembly protein FliH [Devosia crocina]
MAALARFTFDLDLAKAAEEPRPVVADLPPEPAGIPEEVVARLVQEAREEGFADGLIAGEGNATSLAAQTVAAAAGTLAAHAASMTAALDEARLDGQREAIALALSVGRKLAGHLIESRPTAELEALIAECMPSLSGVPHLVIRCHPDLADQIRDIATAQIATSGFAGRLVVMGEPDLRLGDGRLEWVDGGLVRDSEALGADIDQTIADYLAALAGPVGQEHAKESGE